MREEFGELILSTRKANGMTQQDIATALDVSCAYISKIENGHTKTTIGYSFARNLYKILSPDMRLEDFLALAGIVDIASLRDVAESSTVAARFIRMISRCGAMCDQEWDYLYSILKNMGAR